MNETEFSDYEVFKTAKENVTGLASALTDEIAAIKASVATISQPDVFCGKVADSCFEALDLLNRRLEFSTDNFSKISKYFDEVYEGYQKGDEEASKVASLVIGLDENGAVITQDCGSSDVLINKLIEMGKMIASDSRYGYSTGGYGPNSGYTFDCGGLVWYLLNNVYGLNYDTTKGISPYMLSNQLPNYGFQKQKVNGPVDQSQLKVGDLLINPSVDHGHVAIYIGNGQILEARWNYDGKAGDSSGGEISINPYNARIYNSGSYNFKYTEIIHLQGRNLPTTSV